MAVLKYHDGTGWEPVASALQGPTGPTGVAVGLPTGGATGTVLTKASNADYDTTWSIAGKILQVVRATDTTDRVTSSVSFVDASISVTITPQKNNSKIIIIYSGRFIAVQTATAIDGSIQITNNSNTAISGGQDMVFGIAGSTNTSQQQVKHGAFVIAEDSPNTTSAVTYKARFKCSSTNGIVTLENASNTGQMYAIEVAA